MKEHHKNFLVIISPFEIITLFFSILFVFIFFKYCRNQHDSVAARIWTHAHTRDLTTLCTYCILNSIIMKQFYCTTVHCTVHIPVPVLVSVRARVRVRISLTPTLTIKTVNSKYISVNTVNTKGIMINIKLTTINNIKYVNKLNTINMIGLNRPTTSSYTCRKQIIFKKIQ